MLKTSVQAIVDTIDANRSESNPYWNIPLETAHFLYNFILDNAILNILEIGTSTGYSALWLASALEHTGGTLVTVESHRERHAEAIKNFEASGLSNIISVRGHAPEVFKKRKFKQHLPEFDLIFLDATKYEHISYVKAIEHMLAPHGTIIADNVVSHKDAMQEYIDYMNAKPDFSSELLDIGTGLLISKKK